jgi:transcription elongation factor GreA
MENQRILTMTDKANLLKELEELRIAKQEVTEEIKTARGFGDLSENAEYTEAKENEGRIYGRLAEVEELLKNSTFVDDSKLTADVVNMGTVVTVYDMFSGEEICRFDKFDEPPADFIENISSAYFTKDGTQVIVEYRTANGETKTQIFDSPKK